MLPVIRRKAGSSSIACASAAARVSFHRIAGRSTVSEASSTVAPCICPERPMARTPDRSVAAFSAVITWPAASVQSCGACSDQPLCGRETVSGAVASPSRRCASSSTTPFSPDVPRSSPIYMPLPRA